MQRERERERKKAKDRKGGGNGGKKKNDRYFCFTHHKADRRKQQDMGKTKKRTKLDVW